MNRARRVFALTAQVVAASLIAGSCSTNPATGRQSFTAFMSPAEEAQIGREQNPRVIAAMGGVYNDAALAAYVNRIGQSLARQAERPDINYSFTVLNTPIVNALALPGGYIYLTRGILALADNEAELAGVIGHEIGHVTARHHAQAQSRQTAAGLGLTILGSVVGAPIAQGTQVLALAFLRSYSRDQEYEADVLGARYMTRAGYDPRAMATFLNKLGAYTELEARVMGRPSGSDSFSYFATHPNTLDRVHKALAVAATQAPAGPNPIIGRSEYLKQINGMLYGAPPSEGIINGRTYIHPALRIRFEVAPGYELFDTQRQVYALGPANGQMVFDVAQVPPRTSPSAYITQIWARKLNLSNLKAIDVNGLAAATAWGRVRTNRGEMDLHVIAISSGGDTVYRFRFLGPPQPGATGNLTPVENATLQSFRVISQKEAAAAKPLYVRVVTVKRGDTIDSIARRMAFETFKLDRFLVLNGMKSTDRLVSGQQVKIVAQ